MRLTLFCVLVAAATAVGEPKPPTHGKYMAFDTFLKGVPHLVTPPTKPERTESSGIVITQVSCVSKDKPEALRQYFSDAFAHAGLFSPPDVAQYAAEKGEFVTGLDPDNMVSYTVLLQPSATGTNIVFTSADMAHIQPLRSQERIAPVYPGATEVVTSTLEGMKSMTYQADGTPAEIKAFYRSELGRQGFKEADEMVFAKGNDKLMVSVTPGLGKRYVMVQTGGMAISGE